MANETPRPDPDRSSQDATMAGRGAKPLAHDAHLPPFFGGYRILGRLGEGGMSIVYEAVHELRGRREALKVLHQRLENDPAIAERFHREVRAMAGLDQHDHVTPVYDSGEVDGRLYYTMPALPGPTLHELLLEIRAKGEAPPAAAANAIVDAHRLPPSVVPDEPPTVQYARRVAGALVGVADALAHMHVQDVLHRDVKPSNLMLDAHRRVVIADFGLVRTKDQRLTGDEEWLGTPAYMSPEQVTPGKRTIDGRADVYALGATLYELLTLEVPHRGETVAETLGRVLAGRADPVRARNPAVPIDLDTIVARCLEPDPDDRYADAAALASDLEAFAEGADIVMKPVSITRRGVRLLRRHWKVPAAALVVGLASLLWYATRPARISLRTLPDGEVWIDEARVGATPLREHALAPGAHHLEVRPLEDGAALFDPLVLDVILARMEHLDRERYLPAKDPANPLVLAAYAKAQALPRSEIDVTWTASRAGPKEDPALVPLWPRGKVRGAPAEILLEAEGPLTKRHVTLSVEGSAAGPVATWDVASATGPDEPLRWALEEVDRQILQPGPTFVIEVQREDGTVDGRAAFTVMEPAEVQRVDARLRALAEPFPPNDPSVDFLRAEVLREAGLCQEAYAIATHLLETLGKRREVARIGLAALERAGLKDAGPWFDWQGVLLDARK